jgi:transcription antitermination factor NusG
MDKNIGYSDDDLSVNQKVELLAGPFAGFKGIIYSIDRIKNTVVVKINFWGKDTQVELYFHQVKPVN